MTCVISLLSFQALRMMMMTDKPLAFTELPLSLHMLSVTSSCDSPSSPFELSQWPHSVPFPSKYLQSPSPPLDLCTCYPLGSGCCCLSSTHGWPVSLHQMSEQTWPLWKKLSLTTASKQLPAIMIPFPAKEHLLEPVRVMFTLFSCPSVFPI